ncbi:hypothetical protein [Kitasatospora herbaricolor]|uniref:Uncharacterized protein n=1 Tax=Kitasatospora herbaricolor TaxID=68217 RepID=A0ABZ1W7A9_9ACTN|nr:hypothetical protein [Kitasatospora herbaricolor]
MRAHTKAFDLAVRLAVAAGTRARVRCRREGGFLVEAAVPGDLGDEAHRAVLAVLAGADRYGHRYTDTAQAVWAEFDDEREQPQ